MICFNYRDHTSSDDGFIVCNHINNDNRPNINVSKDTDGLSI